MTVFLPDEWANGWPAIDITPAQTRYVVPIMAHIALTYDIPPPPITETIEGAMGDFLLLGCPVMWLLDAWTFSIAFQNEAVRDAVLAELRAHFEGGG